MINIKLHEYWNRLNYTLIGELQENYEKNVSAFIEILVSNLQDKETFEVGVFEDGRQKGSTIIYCETYSRKQLELRTKKTSVYELLLTLYDTEENEIVFKHKLSSAEIDLVPGEIKRLMETVKELNQPMTFYSNKLQ
jgi:hypothetical protein